VDRIKRRLTHDLLVRGLDRGILVVAWLLFRIRGERSRQLR
jgi:hypothetical protein